jgi:hypothetical protein
LWVIILEKNTPQIYFYQETVRRLWVILIRKMTMKPLGGGDFEMATPPATTTTTNHFHGGRNLCLTPF